MNGIETKDYFIDHLARCTLCKSIYLPPVNMTISYVYDASKCTYHYTSTTNTGYGSDWPSTNKVCTDCLFKNLQIASISTASTYRTTITSTTS